jgi:hypothetical protein
VARSQKFVNDAALFLGRSEVVQVWLGRARHVQTLLKDARLERWNCDKTLLLSTTGDVLNDMLNAASFG